MPAKITQQVKAHYTIDDIKALIVADMRAHGFADIVSADIYDYDRNGSVRPPMPIGHIEPFDGFWITKEIEVKPKTATREVSLANRG